MFGLTGAYRLLLALTPLTLLAWALTPLAGVASIERSLAIAQPAGVVSGVDVARIPGVEEAVGRAVDSYDTSRSAGIGHLEFAVLAFADADAAELAMPDVFPALTSVLRQDTREAPPPDLGDEALAWNASGPDTLNIAVLIIRDGTHIHLLTAVAESGEPLDALKSIAARTIGRDAPPTPAETPTGQDARPLTSGGLWDLLPVYGDLPGEFGLYAEESWPVEEPAGVPPPPDPQNCATEPRPESDFGATISATPAAGDLSVSATPDTIATPSQGEPANAATQEAIAVTVREFTACIALGDWSRAYALVTDGFFEEQVSRMPPDLIEIIVSREMMAPVAEGPRLVEVRDVVMLADGRVGAVVEIVTVSGQNVMTETDYMWFEQAGDRWLIDGIATLEGSGEATPSASESGHTRT